MITPGTVTSEVIFPDLQTRLRNKQGTKVTLKDSSESNASGQASVYSDYGAVQMLRGLYVHST